MATLDSLSADISDATYNDLFQLAALRAWSAARGRLDALPKPFPTTEAACGDSFTYEDSSVYGNLGSEDQRMSYTLCRFSERGLPATCTRIIKGLLNHSSVLRRWPTISSQLKIQAEASVREVTQYMQIASCSPQRRKGDFIAMPIDVKTDKNCAELALRLWNRALKEISLELVSGTEAHISNFLEIHAYLRDPIGGLSRSFAHQTYQFRALLKAVYTLQHAAPLSMHNLRRVVAQVTRESALLVAPYLNNVVHIHFRGDQQMAYAYVPLQSLARSEFSMPRHVLAIIREILLDSDAEEGLCPVVPIMIATYPNIVTRKAPKELTIIIDGNHRATAVMLLRMFAWKPKALRGEAGAKLVLQHYCEELQLGAKWRVDMEEVLEELFSASGNPCLELMNSMQPLIQRFIEVNDIPALVVQEESFHTVSMQRTSKSDEKPRLLQPFHQALFNDRFLGFAFPNAGQVHGRTAGFKRLPLIR
ncbi:hypothetical protein ACLMJK_001479 [Lecanora helva]